MEAEVLELQFIDICHTGTKILLTYLSYTPSRLLHFSIMSWIRQGLLGLFNYALPNKINTVSQKDSGTQRLQILKIE